MARWWQPLLVVCAWRAVVDVDAHNSVVCTSTSPSRPGELVFWVGTYHLQADPALTRSVYMELADGTVVEEPYTGCSAQECLAPPCNDDDAGLRGDIPLDWLRTGLISGHCGRAASRTGRALLPRDSLLACYEADPGGDPGHLATPVWHGTGTGPINTVSRQQVNCNGRADSLGRLAARDINTFYAASFQNVVSNDYKLYLARDDEVLEPSPKSRGLTPCATTDESKYTFQVSVADGRKSCPATPPIQANTLGASYAECLRPPAGVNEYFSGYHCSVSCDTGYVLVGQLRCYDGEWSTYECTRQTTCALPGRRGVNGVINTANLWSGNTTHPGTKVWDIWNIGKGTLGTGGNDSLCGDATPAGVACGYTCTADIVAPGIAPYWGGRGVDVDVPSGVRESIICGGDGMWLPGPGYCGCLLPCINFTLAPTPVPNATTTYLSNVTSSPLALLCDVFPDRAYCREGGQRGRLLWVPFMLVFLLCGTCAVLVMGALFATSTRTEEDTGTAEAAVQRAGAAPATQCPVDEITVGIANVAPPYYAFESPANIRQYHRPAVPMQLTLLDRGETLSRVPSGLTHDTDAQAADPFRVFAANGVGVAGGVGAADDDEMEQLDASMTSASGRVSVRDGAGSVSGRRSIVGLAASQDLLRPPVGPGSLLEPASRRSSVSGIQCSRRSTGFSATPPALAGVAPGDFGDAASSADVEDDIRGLPQAPTRRLKAGGTAAGASQQSSRRL